MVLLRGDLDDGGLGAVLIAAEFADASSVNFMATEARGLVCLALSSEHCAQLGLEQIGNRGNQSFLGDSAMVSIEAREGVITGILAADRARTIAVAVDPAATPEDLVQPGHVFPLRARQGGVLERRGLTEAAVDLTRSADLRGAAVLCQVMREDGHMATGHDLELFAARHQIATVTVSAVVRRRRATTPDLAATLANTGRRMREVMGHFATGVSVVTAPGTGGAPVGTTANAISSVSLDPPLLLACLARSSETLAAIRAAGRFGINILSNEQRHHSDRFAKKGDAIRSHEVDFDDHDLGVPVLPDSLATVVCEIEAIHPAGDHVIVVGLAHHLEHRGPGAWPLLFWRGSYAQIRIDEDELGS